MASWDSDQGQPDGEAPAIKSSAQSSQVQALQALAQIMASDLELDALLPAALDKLLDVFKVAETGAIFLYEPGPATLILKCASGYDAAGIQRLRTRSDESIVDQVFRFGRSQLCSTSEPTAKEKAGVVGQGLKHSEHTGRGPEAPRSTVCVPLLSCEGTAGALIMETRQEPPFSHSDVELAESMAGLLAMCLDRRRLLGEAKHSRQVMHDVSSLQQDIMASLSHDMRTPLASIKGYASALLLDEVEWDPGTEREYLSIVVDEADKLNDIIADLLDSSVIEAGRMTIEKEPMLLARLASEVVGEIEPRTTKHHFLVSFPAGFPIVDADAGRIRRVLYNLVDNSVKYSPDGGLIVVRGEVSANEVVITVADQGHGIAPEHLNRLFERFFRVKFVSGQHVVGSGLGLPIARKIVEAHGGRIWAESKLGEGTTVHFTLPRGGISDGVEGEQD